MGLNFGAVGVALALLGALIWALRWFSTVRPKRWDEIVQDLGSPSPRSAREALKGMVVPSAALIRDCPDVAQTLFAECRSRLDYAAQGVGELQPAATLAKCAGELLEGARDLAWRPRLDTILYTRHEQALRNVVEALLFCLKGIEAAEQKTS